MVIREGVLVYEAKPEEGTVDAFQEEERRSRMRKILESDQG